MVRFRFSGKKESDLRSALLELNDEFVREKGQDFCRCCGCLARSLVQKFGDGKFVNREDFSRRLASFIQQANATYLKCVGYRPGELEGNLLNCRSDCNWYEENVEACPFTFWEHDDDKEDGLQRLVQLLLG